MAILSTEKPNQEAAPDTLTTPKEVSISELSAVVDTPVIQKESTASNDQEMSVADEVETAPLPPNSTDTQG